MQSYLKILEHSNTLCSSKFPWARQINSSRFMQIRARVVNKVRQPSYRCCVLRNYSTKWHTLLCGYECQKKMATINGIGWLVEKVTRLLCWKHWGLYWEIPNLRQYLRRHSWHSTYVTRMFIRVMANSLRHEYWGNRERVCETEGEMRGTKTMTVSGTTFCSFKGIPYAKPPLGSLRFSVSTQRLQ